MFDYTRYAKYPEFQEKLIQLSDAKMQELKALHESLDRVVGTMDLETVIDQYDQNREALHTKYQQLVEQAHQHYGAPLLQEWDHALKQTGQAAYHEASPQQDRSCQATLGRKDNQIILTLHETLMFPAEKTTQIGSFLIYHNIRTTTWEAVPAHSPAAEQQEQQEKGEANHER